MAMDEGGVAFEIGEARLMVMRRRRRPSIFTEIRIVFVILAMNCLCKLVMFILAA